MYNVRWSVLQCTVEPEEEWHIFFDCDGSNTESTLIAGKVAVLMYKKYLRSKIKVNMQQQTAVPRWRPPRQGYLKCNVDSSFFDATGATGGVGVYAITADDSYLLEPTSSKVD
ncbi:hypothetical protein L195_g013077 [Trifolium pratense]|uniref:Uncharacterized protein n=1 Tax=Trifolium pratense TaxID=57577 RepID=A0A2K3PM52_TRIPR|nr:hypothetical protein L195_g013077 [Trifolium pratense]